jgi:hypothetical protein
MLEGWAIVDNTSGEDWKDVKVGVGSSSALSFRYDLWSVRTVERELLQIDEQFAVAPPTAVSPYGGAQQGQGAVMVAELGDDEIRRPAGHPENLDARLAKNAEEAEAYAPSRDDSERLRPRCRDADYAPTSTGSSRGGGAGVGGGYRARVRPARRRPASPSRPTRPRTLGWPSSSRSGPSSSTSGRGCPRATARSRPWRPT